MPLLIKQGSDILKTGGSRTKRLISHMESKHIINTIHESEDHKTIPAQEEMPSRARPIRFFWVDTDVFHFSLPITNIFALLKPQLKDITVHFFLQYVLCTPQNKKSLHKLQL